MHGFAETAGCLGCLIHKLKQAFISAWATGRVACKQHVQLDALQHNPMLYSIHAAVWAAPASRCCRMAMLVQQAPTADMCSYHCWLLYAPGTACQLTQVPMFKRC
jgi:hypothetical protein